MGFKVVLILFVAMLLFTHQNNAETVGDFITCMQNCMNSCPFYDPTCGIRCPIQCGFSQSVDTTDKVQIGNRICNVGCSLGHCYEFLIKNDKVKYGSCMSGCSENYCIGNIALMKA